ncbi:DUF4145 domain-containing protein [Pseudomonas sp. CC6-YY-74]|uniref:DUF4145 domain-containing protein n=1 Tax=Pseudomonas sp. CC6-YY-74 TaxID=1930532 RepID=UPI001C43FB94|nr:DUF4145 domain-containing protein [Pseudomonas sp. CC6-YY-74]
MNNKLSKRFQELEEEMGRVGETKHVTHSEMFGKSEHVDAEALLEWRVKVKNLIVKVCGKESEHYEAFKEKEKDQAFTGSLSKYRELKAVFKATKDDFDGGYLASYKSIVQAEVFDTELEQAYELLSSGYYVAAAVICGVVLETALRELCDQSGIAYGKLDKMNADLAKAGIYNKIVQKQITAHAGLRNSAAHGNQSEFSKQDVEQMLPAVEQFLSVHLAS